MTQPSPVKARLVAEGGWDKAFAVINLDSDLDLTIPPMRVPTCQLQHGFGPDSVDIVPYPKANVDLQSDAESFYGRHGVNILATCTPYQVGNLPMRGEHCAWMESSAVIYANSVLGARTNCEGIASTGAASLTGQDPLLGQPPGGEPARDAPDLGRRRAPWSRSRTGGCSGTSPAGSRARTTR